MNKRKSTHIIHILMTYGSMIVITNNLYHMFVVVFIVYLRTTTKDQIGEVDVLTHYGYDWRSAQTMCWGMRGCHVIFMEVR
jgi:hypothetical protein